VRAFYLRHEYAVIYVASGVLYVALGMEVRALLNWIVGPIWPIACMWFVPVLVRRLAGWADPLPGERGPRP